MKSQQNLESKYEVKIAAYLGFRSILLFALAKQNAISRPLVCYENRYIYRRSVCKEENEKLFENTQNRKLNHRKSVIWHVKLSHSGDPVMKLIWLNVVGFSKLTEIVIELEIRTISLVNKIKTIFFKWRIGTQLSHIYYDPFLRKLNRP